MLKVGGWFDIRARFGWHEQKDFPPINAGVSQEGIAVCAYKDLSSLASLHSGNKSRELGYNFCV